MESLALRSPKAGPLGFKSLCFASLSETLWAVQDIVVGTLILASMEEQDDGRNVVRVFEMGMEFYTGQSSQK